VILNKSEVVSHGFYSKFAVGGVEREEHGSGDKKVIIQKMIK
jgi:hypothetical protein